MQNRWNDADAAALDGLDLPVYTSRLVGADTSRVVWGGGNTSIKTVERDHRGREQRVLRVKRSGSVPAAPAGGGVWGWALCARMSETVPTPEITDEGERG
jgi:rhamnose utilization protein RhaD (predicted bifunctional aldolase and dehydrogenase)